MVELLNWRWVFLVYAIMESNEIFVGVQLAFVQLGWYLNFSSWFRKK